jgi:hypothetical protein
MIRRSLLSSAALLGVTFGIAPIAVQADNARDWQNLPTDLNMIRLLQPDRHQHPD